MNQLVNRSKTKTTVED